MIQLNNYNAVTVQATHNHTGLRDIIIRLVAVAILLAVVTMVTKRNDKALPQPSATAMAELCKRIGK